MARVKLDYKVVNQLDKYIVRQVGKRMFEKGVKVRKEDIYKEIAEYCGVQVDNIKHIKHNVSQPSLALALKIAKYFGVAVNDIFEIVERGDDE